jgi:hypothetical protein
MFKYQTVRANETCGHVNIRYMAAYETDPIVFTCKYYIYHVSIPDAFPELHPNGGIYEYKVKFTLNDRYFGSVITCRNNPDSEYYPNNDIIKMLRECLKKEFKFDE